MKLKSKLLFFLLIFCFTVSSEDFSSFFKTQIENIYKQKYSEKSNNSHENKGWNRISAMYSDIFSLRLQADINKSELQKRIESLIDDINDGKINGLTAYETDLVKGVLYGSLAYINSFDPSFGMFRNIRKSKNLFEELHKNYNTADTGFGSDLTDIALGLYFQDSFWVKTIMGYCGNINRGLKGLDNTAFGNGITKVEANLFLIEYFSMILQDHNSSIKYSKNLIELYPESKYFKYLYSKDLYHTGKIKQALDLFKDINDNIADKFYAFDYDSIIYEAKCLYILGDSEGAEEVIKYAGKIHDGYILEKFRNEWKSSVRIRQESIYKIQNSAGADLSLSDDELKRTAFILFDHGYFREVNRIIGYIKMKDPELTVLNFKNRVIMREWKKALELYYKIDNDDYFKSHPDTNRLLLLKNIALNHTE